MHDGPVIVWFCRTWACRCTSNRLERCVTAQLVAAGPRQSYTGWRRLEVALAKTLKATKAARNPQGYIMIAVGALMIGMIAYTTISDPTTVVQRLDELLRR